MDDFELEIKKEFINEALMNLEEVESCFMELESTAEPKPLVDKIFRMAHNLKGGSRAVGFGDVAEFTHHLENLVLKIQKNEVHLTSEVVTTLLRCNDRLVEMFNSLKSDISASFKNDDLIQSINSWLSPDYAQRVQQIINPLEQKKSEFDLDTITKKVEPTVSTIESKTKEENNSDEITEENFSAPPASAFFDEPTVSPPIITIPVAVAAAAVPTPAVTSATQDASSKQVKGNEDEVIRVSLSRIDLLNNYVGELIVLQSVIQQQAQNELSQKISQSVHQMMKLSKDIQSVAMGLRMLPVKPLIQKLQRVVRDTAKLLNKEVELNLIGDQLEIDKSVLDRLADPLIHILRNAVDHGLETAEERVKNGKTKQGHILLSFKNEGNHLVVEVEDDGKGINSDVIRQKAIEKNLISPTQSLSEKQIINLIFHPGFSTKAVTSEISGRGVGMDVVKTNIENIGGHVDVSTQAGKGSLFKLQIPLSLAVIDGLIVASESSRYAIPLSQVQETVNLKSIKVYENKTAIGTCIDLRGTVVPIFSIENLLRGNYSGADKASTCLIFQVDGRPVGLAVHEILRSQQVVIKPIAKGVKPQKGWIGSCVLGDGLPTLIVSPIDLLTGVIVDNKNTFNYGATA